ncbi:MAG: transcriptional regulator [Rubrivivax sp.]|nr:transcriptional regulator [Rubrivivax sp.]
MKRVSSAARGSRPRPQAPVRRYDDACGTAHGLELLGDRWALLVVRELLLGGRRFSQLRADLPGISANVLTQRLAELEERGILVHRRLAPPASVSIYELTPWGHEAETIVLSLGRWAARSPLHDPTLQISPVSTMLSLRTMFSAAHAGDMQARVVFMLGDETYCCVVSKGQFTLERGAVDGADVIFEGTAQGLAAAVHGGQSFKALAAAGLLRVTGDLLLARKFARVFPLPDKVSKT